MKSKTPVLATDYRFQGHDEMAVGRNGELNAGSKRDLLQQQVRLLQATSRGEVATASAMERAQKSHHAADIQPWRPNTERKRFPTPERFSEIFRRAPRRETRSSETGPRCRPDPPRAGARPVRLSARG